MTRYTLHVPRVDNHGAPVDPHELELIENQLVAVAGGWTSTRGVGAWRSPDTGTSYREPVTLYHVDSDADIAPELLTIAERAAERLEQEAVYVTAQDISVTLVTRGAVVA